MRPRELVNSSGLKWFHRSVIPVIGSDDSAAIASIEITTCSNRTVAQKQDIAADRSLHYVHSLTCPTDLVLRMTSQRRPEQHHSSSVASDFIPNLWVQIPSGTGIELRLLSPWVAESPTN